MAEATTGPTNGGATAVRLFHLERTTEDHETRLRRVDSLPQQVEDLREHITAELKRSTRGWYLKLGIVLVAAQVVDDRVLPLILKAIVGGH